VRPGAFGTARLPPDERGSSVQENAIQGEPLYRVEIDIKSSCSISCRGKAVDIDQNGLRQRAGDRPLACVAEHAAAGDAVNSLRLLAWNIRQGGGSRLTRIADALARQDADILVLSEYRGGDAATRLLAMLATLGYRHVTKLTPPLNRNGVLTASRGAFYDQAQSALNCRSPTGW
jgi:hypothetical protein